MPRIKEEVARCARLTDDDLWAAVPRMVREEREDLVLLLIHLAEIERRELHLAKAYSGLFPYLWELGYSGWDCRARAMAASLGRKYPSLWALLRSGRITLTAVAMLGSRLTPENHRVILRKACRRSTRELQALLAELDPQAGRRDIVRVVSSRTSAPALPPEATAASDRALGEEVPATIATGKPADQALGEEVPPTMSAGKAASDAPKAPPASGCNREDSEEAPASDASAVLPAWDGGLFPETPAASASEPLGERRLRFHFDGPESLDALLQRARGLLWHKYPTGDLEFVLRDAVNALLDRIDPERRFQRRVNRARKKAVVEHRGIEPGGRAAS